MLLSIVGPTAVGKTGFALAVAQEIIHSTDYQGIDLVSADSRQVYQGLEIVSGADLPVGFSQQTNPNFSYPFYESEPDQQKSDEPDQDQPGQLRLHGVAIVAPDQEWSVKHFQELVLEVLAAATADQRLVILVGGTGLYHDRALERDPQLRVGPNPEVRKRAEQMSLTELQSWAEEVNPEKLASLNHSDRQNPRRLVRVIEFGLAAEEIKSAAISSSPPNFTEIPAVRHEYVGLSDNFDEISSRISLRVKERFDQGALTEVKELLSHYADPQLPALSATGVTELHQYLTGQLDEAQCLELWSQREVQYAKRQLTWWQDQPVEWFQLDNIDWKSKAFDYILTLCSK